MKVTLYKRDKESNERAITRFNKQVQASRKLNQVRSSRYHAKKPTKKYLRQSAIMRDHYRTIREKKSFY